MNKKLSLFLLALCSTYLIVFYILKIVCPEWVLLQVTNPTIVRIGRFFQSSIWLMRTFQILTTFITFYLFICAARGKFGLKWYEALYLLAAATINQTITDYLTQYAVHTSVSLMLILALLCKGKLLYATPSFVIYGFASQLMLTIRGFETILQTFNIATGLVLGLDAWVWLFVFALIFNIKERENNVLRTTIYRQDGGITTEGNPSLSEKNCKSPKRS